MIKNILNNLINPLVELNIEIEFLAPLGQNINKKIFTGNLSSIGALKYVENFICLLLRFRPAGAIKKYYTFRVHLNKTDFL